MTAPAGAAEDGAFSSLPLPPPVQDNLRQLGYLQMTPIQAASLPLTLQGKDLIAQARTRTELGLYERPEEAGEGEE